MKTGRRNRFTLIELLVVIAIIAILAGMLLPALNNVKEQGRSLTCKTNIKSLTLGAIQYAHDFNDRWLPWQQGRYKYMADSERDYKWFYNILLPQYVGVTPNYLHTSALYAFAFWQKKYLCPVRAAADGTVEWSGGYQQVSDHYGMNYFGGYTYPDGVLQPDGYSQSSYYLLNKIKKPSGKLIFTEAMGNGCPKNPDPQYYKLYGETDPGTFLYHIPYRHAKRYVNATFFDGHVETMTSGDLFSTRMKPRIWLPYLDK